MITEFEMQMTVKSSRLLKRLSSATKLYVLAKLLHLIFSRGYAFMLGGYATTSLGLWMRVSSNAIGREYGCASSLARSS